VRTFVLLAVLAPAAVAAGKDAPVAAPKAWLGTFAPASKVTPCDDCKAPRVVPRAGSVRVLPPADGGAPPEGDVVIASPLLGLAVHGRVDAGRVAMEYFAFDQRDSDDGVIVLPGNTVARFVVPTAADVAAIKEALVRDDALSVGARATALKALRDVEIGALDLDGDGKADVAATYGCNAWGDGSCQSRGQFFLARRGTKWVEIE
jgi:hypothetical protein